MNTMVRNPGFASRSYRILGLLAIAGAIGVAAVWNTAEAATPSAAEIGPVPSQKRSEHGTDGHAPLALAGQTQVGGTSPSAAALELARRLLDPQLSPRLQAQLPDLGDPRAPSAAPASRWGTEIQLWPELRFVPVPDVPPAARLDRTFG
jgi:hypothetical protein